MRRNSTTGDVMEKAFTLAGSGLLVWGAYLTVKMKLFLRKSAPTTGVIVKHIRTSDIDGKDAYFPVIEFKTASGKTEQFKSRTSYARSTQRVGEEIAVLYDPLNPRRAEINSFLTLWIFPVSMLGVGMIILAAGLFFGD